MEPSPAVGIRLEIVPDAEIFRVALFKNTVIRDRLEECALLHSGVRISFLDESSGVASHFNFETGIRSYVQKLNVGRTPLHAVAVFKGEEQGVSFEVGIQFCAERREIIRGYVNDYRCDMGTHLTGIRIALTKSLKKAARTSGSFSQMSIRWASKDKGLTSVISIRISNPQYYGATKHKLRSPSVRKVLTTEIGKCLDKFFADDPDAAASIIREGLHE